MNKKEITDAYQDYFMKPDVRLGWVVEIENLNGFKFIIPLEVMGLDCPPEDRKKLGLNRFTTDGVASVEYFDCWYGRLSSDGADGTDWIGPHDSEEKVYQELFKIWPPSKKGV